LQTRRGLWIAALLALILLEGMAFRAAVGGDWYAGGNDMGYILTECRKATGKDVAGWLTGSWIGHEIFTYYRPVTSLAMYGEYRLFGERSAPWQALSLCLHMGSTLMLALLCRRLFRSATAGWVGAAVWGFRDRMLGAIQWTPAQTDMLAGFFALLALLTLKLYLDGRKWFWLPISSAAALLAMASKEVALILPALATLLVLHAPGIPRRSKAALIGGAWLIAAAFVAWRLHALGGLGFLPGQPVPRTAARVRNTMAPIEVGGLAHRLLAFLLPTPVGPSTSINMLAVWAAAATAAGVLLASRRGRERLAWAVLAGGFLLVTFLLDGLDGWAWWLLPNTYWQLFIGVLALWLMVLAVGRRPKDCLLLLGWGIAVWLPLYHVVYNVAGNVTYLPETYWGLAWACLTAAVTLPLPAKAEAEAPPALTVGEISG